MLGGACERSYSSLARLCTSSTPCFLFCPGLTQLVLFLLCCFNGAAHFTFGFYVSLSGSVVCGVFRGSLWEHNCAISTTPKLHFVNFHISLPLDLFQKHGCKKYKSILRRDYRYSTNTNVFTVWRTNTYIHTYIQTLLAFNTLMWGSLRLAPTREALEVKNVHVALHENLK